jgi:hypothetical protein
VRKAERDRLKEIDHDLQESFDALPWEGKFFIERIRALEPEIERIGIGLSPEGSVSVSPWNIPDSRIKTLRDQLRDEGWDVIDQNRRGPFYGSICVLLSGYKIIDVPATTVHLVAISYENKDEAKSRGFKWDRDKKEWWTRIDGETAPVFISGLPFAVSETKSFGTKVAVVRDKETSE